MPGAVNNKQVSSGQLYGYLPLISLSDSLFQKCCLTSRMQITPFYGDYPSTPVAGTSQRGQFCRSYTPDAELLWGLRDPRCLLIVQWPGINFSSFFFLSSSPPSKVPIISPSISILLWTLLASLRIQEKSGMYWTIRQTS